MNIDFLSTFNDIKEHILHYFNELCMTKENSFTLFMYGPYIANHMPTCYESYPSNNTDLDIQNDLFRLMYEVALMNKINTNNNIKFAKDMCLTIIERNRNKQYKYSRNSIDIAYGIIKNIRDTQYDNNTLESAMLNYFPIVQYVGTIVNPEMEHHIDILNIDQSELDEKIVSILVNNVAQIMLNDTAFINIDDMIKHLHNHKEFTIPYEYIDTINTTDISKLYFSLVFLKYVVLNNDIPIYEKDLIKINNQYNKIIKCENVNISDAIEAFTRFSIDI